LEFYGSFIVNDGFAAPSGTLTSLPGKKALLKRDTDIEVVLIDATESPTQRPRKNSDGTTPARKSGTC